MGSDQNKKIRVGLVLQGGGALGAEQAGMIAGLVLNPNIEIKIITGVSAGLINGATVKQVFNHHGYSTESRRMVGDILMDKWLNRIGLDPISSATVQQAQDNMDAVGHAIEAAQSFGRVANIAPLMQWMTAPAQIQRSMILRQAKALYSTMFKNLINNSVVINPDALQSTENVALYGEAVNATTMRGRIFGPHEMTSDVLMASASLPDVFHPVQIGDHFYIDGACQGGSNAPIEPIIDHLGDLDVVIGLATNPPNVPYQDKNPRSLGAKDLEQSNGLILTQGLWPLVQLMERREKGQNIPPVHIVWRRDDHVIFTQKDKLNTSRRFLCDRFIEGFETIRAFIVNHGETLDSQPSMTSDHFKKIARRNAHQGRHLVAA